jgi:hypothetical protein
MKNLLLCLALIPFAALFAQTDDSWKLYDDSDLARVDITVEPSILDWIYSHAESDSEHYAVARFQNNWFDETVDSIGFRLRGNTSRQSAKKSFKVSFNTFIQGREFHGVDKLNLNGEHNDPSIIRSKLCFDHFQEIGMIASRASHAEVYINENYYGLYVSVEHVDDEFLNKHFSDDSGNLWKCLYPADLNYLGDDPEFYKNLYNGSRPVYELTTNEEVGDFRPLARFIRVLNLTPANSLPDSLEAILDVPSVLKYFAMNILLGSWDDYWSLMNNYYLYHNPSEDRITLIPYDYDNTYGIDFFGIDWSSASPYNFPKVQPGDRPLAERLLAYNQYRDLYTHFLEFYRAHVFQLSLWEHRIDRVRDMITSAALADNFRELDWGFTDDDFTNSYSATHYENQQAKFGLKEFVNLRNESLPNQLSYVHAPPIVYQIDVEPLHPVAGDSIVVMASCFASDGIKTVSIQFTPEGSSSPQSFPMSFEPVSNTKIVEEADRWRGVLPPLGAGQSGSLLVLATDSLNRSQLYPRTGGVKIATAGVAASNVVLNEFMADNDNVIADPAGDFDDWVELYNSGSSPVLLTGMYLTDNADNFVKWQFTQPNLMINPDEYLLVWCDDEEEEDGVHTNFALGAGGEYLALVDTDGVTVLDSLTFGPQVLDVAFGRYPNGSGPWQTTLATPGAENQLPPNSVSDDEVVPRRFSLAAFPNPFNATTVIRFEMPGSEFVTLKVFDILGREVATLVEQRLAAGVHQWPFDASLLPSGVYVYRFQAGVHDESGRVLLLR